MTTSMAATPIPPLPAGLPAGARDVATHEGDGRFLGWTFQVRHWITRRTSYRFILPEGPADPLRCSSLLDAVNCLRGPAGLPALVDDQRA